MRMALGLAALVLGSVALAQPPAVYLPQPRIASVFPSGAQAGTAVEITVNGTDLDDADAILFSHPGLSATIIVPPEMPDPKAKTDPKAKPPAMAKKGPPPTAIKVKVTVAANVPVGLYDVRIVNKFGVSNPRTFVVGDRPEVNEVEPNDDANPGEPGGSLAGGSATLPTKSPRAQRVELGTVVNGVIGTPTDVDYSIFFGKANQRVLIFCATASIDSKARPLVEVYDPTGKRLALNRHYNGGDALADLTLPADGDYYIRVSEFAYQQGGPDYFYRLTVGAGPWIDAIHPPMVNPGKPSSVTVYGRGLPGGQVVSGMFVDGRPIEAITATVNPPTDPASRTRLAYLGRGISPAMGLQDGFEFRLPGVSGSSNGVPVFLTEGKIHIEKEAGNDKVEGAEEIPVPCEVAGRIDKRYDRDFYTFIAKKGDTYYIEATAERIGSTADLYLRVRTDKGQELAGELDDDIESLHPISFFSRSGDPPAFKFVAPADGKFTILVGSLDANVSFGPRSYYRLKIAPPTPDFRPVVMARSKDLPATVVAQPNGEVAFDLFVNRTDGFTGPVIATVEGLPNGVTAKPALIGTGMKWGTLILSADATAKEFTGSVTVKCTAEVAGKPIAREARPASITWGLPQQQNVPTVTRLDRQLVLAVRAEKATFRLATDLAAATVKSKDKDGKDAETKVAGPIFVKPGDKLTVPVKVTWQDAEARANPVAVGMEPTVQNMQNAPITANNNQPMQLAKEKNDGPLTFDVKANAPPGSYALVIRGDTTINYVRDPSQKDKKTPITVTAFAPAIELTVLPTTLAKLTATPAVLKLGAKADLTVTVDRQNDYAGEFKVSVALPKDQKGLTVADAVIPAGKDSVVIPITVASDAKPGAIQNVVVTAIGTVHGKFPISHEVKVNLTVQK